MGIRGSVSHIDLNVADVEVSALFYDLVLGRLGFERVPTDSARARWSLITRGAPTFEIEVRSPGPDSGGLRHERYGPGLDHLALHAASRQEVDQLHRALVGAGYQVADPPREYDYTPGYYAVAFDDPSGMRIEVVHDPSTNPD